MKRKLLIVALSLGSIGGFACGLQSLRDHRQGRHRHFKHEVTQICADAVRQAQADAAPPQTN